jgi:hypothetical protein
MPGNLNPCRAPPLQEIRLAPATANHRSGDRQQLTTISPTSSADLGKWCIRLSVVVQQLRTRLFGGEVTVGCRISGRPQRRAARFGALCFADDLDNQPAFATPCRNCGNRMLQSLEQFLTSFQLAITPVLLFCSSEVTVFLRAIRRVLPLQTIDTRDRLNRTIQCLSSQLQRTRFC